jgi:hypothetical protein
MTLRYAGTCLCGSDVPAGAEVVWTLDESTGRYRIGRCPACADLARGSVEVPRHPEGITLAESARRRRIREGRKRGRT